MILLITFNVFFKLTGIQSIISMMNTPKFEPWPRLLQTTTSSDDCKTLRQRPTLQALLTSIWVVEYLTTNRGVQE
jgi:hypothetical protein